MDPMADASEIPVIDYEEDPTESFTGPYDPSILNGELEGTEAYYEEYMDEEDENYWDGDGSAEPDLFVSSASQRVTQTRGAQAETVSGHTHSPKWHK